MRKENFVRFYERFNEIKDANGFEKLYDDIKGVSVFTQYENLDKTNLLSLISEKLSKLGKSKKVRDDWESKYKEYQKVFKKQYDEYYGIGKLDERTPKLY